jgi:fatty-acyl-CoA synthase
MPKSVISSLLEKLPHIRFWQFYGQTEMAPVATVLYPEDHHDYPSSVGRPVFHVETAIMAEDGQLLAHGEIGEIVHKSPHLTLGYANQPEKTTEAFAYGWFHSGDLGYFDTSGHLYIVDRIKDIVKTGGENVATREVEEIIYLFQGVKEVAVFGIPHPHWIEAVTAVVVLQDETNFEPETLLEHCKQHLAHYKMPKSLHIVKELPKNASGKILKRQLREQYQDYYAQNQIA